LNPTAMRPHLPGPRLPAFGPLALSLALALLAAPFAAGQAPGREANTTEPALRGRAAHAPTPARYHVRNEGGSDGAGLCVVSSILANGMAVGIPGFDRPGLDEASGRSDAPGKGSELWTTAKARPGGYSPTKLEALLGEVAPAEKWASYVGTDPGILEKLSRAGYPIGATMNTGELYGGRRIHHMVSLGHFDRDQDLAMYQDNNRPGVFTWVTAREYARRWIDNGTGWAFSWLHEPFAASIAGELAALILVAGVLVALGVRRARSPEPPATDSDPYFPGDEPDEW
jgi:hypothetical protein